MTKGLKHQLYKEKLRDLEMGKKKGAYREGSGRLPQCVQIAEGRVKKR